MRFAASVYYPGKPAVIAQDLRSCEANNKTV